VTDLHVGRSIQSTRSTRPVYKKSCSTRLRSRPTFSSEPIRSTLLAVLAKNRQQLEFDKLSRSTSSPINSVASVFKTSGHSTRNVHCWSNCIRLATSLVANVTSLLFCCVKHWRFTASVEESTQGRHVDQAVCHPFRLESISKSFCYVKS